MLWKLKLRFLENLKLKLFYVPAKYLLGIPKGLQVLLQKYWLICVSCFTLYLGQEMEQAEKPTTDEWTKRMWYINA